MESNLKKDLQQKIGSTLGQLINNAEVLEEISSNPSYKEEVIALYKMQESLLAHLMHLDQSLAKNKNHEMKQIRSQLSHFSILNPSINDEVMTYFNKKRRRPLSNKPKIHKAYQHHSF